ncbi:MAG: HAMP domain-containing histidine kinase [Spirochaetaceae bacterium]|nr:HAMP domain-containing histidine kinase [Spirochaetaceae bacterium]
MNSELTIWHIVIQILFIITTILLIYIVFEDDIKRLTLENQKLSSQIEKSKVFVNLGENIAGLIHNMNGDIGLMSMSVSLLEEEVDHPVLKYVSSGNRRLQAKIRNILTLARFSQNEEEMEFSINDLLHSLIEVFSINKEFQRIKVNKDFQDEVRFFGHTSEVSQIFENLIKNAYEALIEKLAASREKELGCFTPHLTITIKGDISMGSISFADNGPGIKACMARDCRSECFSCTVFKVGRTTKSSGTGLGMISVQRTLKKYKGQMKISTSQEGSDITIMLPRPQSVSLKGNSI